ncbi:hypothetical protein C6P46_004470 [Rhodotorula mucilaginosa]|uniref:Uncharacterized protein n=1 Tax=Rhodotorula mucilaginosa TaxID=5537 RepID=A0A9P7B6I2_RHOMI|nr:hypothetical protein C6P46_004470 [Rhodotorula mucilaginosa]
MATARQPRSSPPAAHDFVARIASWRTSPSTSDYSPIASVEGPLLARTDAGWSRTPTEDVATWKPSEAGPTTTTQTRRWLVGCFAVILLAGSGWRISTTGNADLGSPAEIWNAAHESFSASSTTVQGGHLALHSEQAEIAGDLEDDWASPPFQETIAPVAPTSTTAIASLASEAAPDPVPSWNVHPRPRPPNADLHSRSTTKYLAYENHSGFHNQRKSLVNALVLAQLLNRTLLLPPARLGHAMPWEPDPKHTVVFSERCKAGLEPDKPAATNPKSHLIGLGEACDPSTGWTYVGWDYLIEPDLLQDHALVDRWNSSTEWLTSTTEGLGLATADIHTFEDTARRSYQILDSRDTALDGSFESRLELDDLRDPVGIGSKRLLWFGSLFSGSRLKLVGPKNKALHDETSAKMILRNEGLDAISDQVRDALGSYVAVHARVGDGVFKSHAPENMHRLFLRLCTEVFGLSKAVAERLYKTSEPRRKRRAGLAHRAREHRAELVHPVSALFVDYSDVDEVGEFDRASVPSNASPLFASDEAETNNSRHLVRRKPLRGSPARPLAPHLRCRGNLHESPHLARLNTPLYIATDSRRPTSDPNLAPFFRWFPCTFLLGDFSAATGAVNEVNVEPIAELVRLAGAAKTRDEAKGTTPTPSQWTSDWDGTDLGKFLLPFLEAEATRAVRVLGTHQSTFSGYTTTILHDNYVENGLVAPWNSP